MSRDWTNLLWREKTWGERAQTAVAFSAACVVGLGMLLGALVVLGMMIETAGQRSEDHDRCMKRATNGYEIERCR
jgi:hypothetical protein